MTDTKLVKQEIQWGQSRQFLEQDQLCLKKKWHSIATRHKDNKSGRNQKEKDWTTDELKIRKKKKPLCYQKAPIKKSQIANQGWLSVI